MARPLISTKLFIPKVRRHVVTRPRLLDRLRRGTESRLTLVSAPAGFGKTTLLAEWLGGREGDHCRTAWVSLDAADRDPASFWTYFVSALQLQCLASGVCLELISRSDVSTESVITMVLNDLAWRRLMSGWCSMITTSLTATRSPTGWSSCLTTFRPTST
jgi:LuxR family maltose regulon positive regulatory protein